MEFKNALLLILKPLYNKHKPPKQTSKTSPILFNTVEVAVENIIMYKNNTLSVICLILSLFIYYPRLFLQE